MPLSTFEEVTGISVRGAVQGCTTDSISRPPSGVQVRTVFGGTVNRGGLEYGI
jgi:hypothetical protein